MQIPSIDQNFCGAWTQQQTDLYHKMDFYFLEAQADYRKHFAIWSKLLNRISWKPNMGPIMRRVAAEPTPVLRQEALPALITAVPKTDVINYRERHMDARIRWQDFVSPHFYFLPEFQDFMKHIDRNMENINRQITIFEDIFYRTMLFHHAPYVYVAGVGLVAAPMGDPNSAGTAGKTNAWLQAQVAALMGVQTGYLTFQELFKVLNAAEQDAGMTPFEGSGKPSGDSAPLNERFAFVCSSEAWNNFVDDPWLKENRPLNMNIVTDTFKGDLWGRIRCKLERYAQRYAADNDGAVTMPVPEVTEENPDDPYFGRTKPNLAYSQPTRCQIEVGYLVGGNSADIIDVGPPPSEFVKDLDQGAVTKMNWNGKAYMTKDFLVPCADDRGTVHIDANSFGRFLRIQATLALGISPFNMQNILPVIYKRKVGVNTVS